MKSNLNRLDVVTIFRYLDQRFEMKMSMKCLKGTEYKPIEYGEESNRMSIVVAVWLIVFLHTGNMKAVGVLLPILQHQFETYTRTIGVILSLLPVSGGVFGKYQGKMAFPQSCRHTCS